MTRTRTQANINGKGLSPQARRRVKEFEKAVENNSWIGAQHPDEWEAIADAYTKAKQKLMVYIWGLEQRAKSIGNLDS